MASNRNWLTAIEIGLELGVDSATVRRWIKEGLIAQKYILILPHKQRGAIRIHADALRAMIECNQSTVTS